MQTLVLAHAREHAQLVGNLGNIALLRMAGAAGLVPTALAAEVADAYRTYRKRQHQLRLNNAEYARVSAQEFADEREAVRKLWGQVMGA